MKLLLFSITIILLTLTGCSNKLPLAKTQLSIKSNKKELISQANMGNIKAMIELNKKFVFPETKEGFDYYNKWYPLVLQSKNSSDIMDFAEVFYEYKDMFISGKEKYVALLEAAANEKFKKPLFKLLQIYLYDYDHKKIKDTQSKILLNASKEDLTKIYDLYLNMNKEKDVKKIETIIVQKGYSIPVTKKFLRFKNFRNLKKEEVSKILNDILASNEYEKIVTTANILKIRREYEKSKLFFKKAITLKNDDADTYVEYADLYDKMASQHRVLSGKDEKYKDYQEEIISNLKEAIKYGQSEAYGKLLKVYSKEKYFKNDYELLIEKLSKTTQGNRILANSSSGSFFTPDDNIKDYYTKAAMNGDEESIVHLATRVPYTYQPDLKRDEDTKKWQEYILNSNNPALQKRFKKVLFSYKYKNSKSLENVKVAITNIDLKNDNIFTLRRLYRDLKNSNPTKAIEYLQKAVNFGDVSSTYELIKVYRQKNTKEDILFAIKTLEELAIKGDRTAAIKTALHYDLTSKNKTKAVKYYEIASSLGDRSSTETLARIFMCESCKSTKELIDYKKAKFYAQRLVDEGIVKYNFNLGWLYTTGNGVKKDVKKAIYYFTQSYNLANEETAAYNIGLIYKDGDGEVKKDLTLAKSWLKKANTKEANKVLQEMKENNE
ncbi:MAG: tetratricopeptide repeat protein [Arcobacter sp.]|uniref:tetratricopeptide repeat protein n=1 Tax=Arcobacter sp. TaxID=1872629 RepID=UPI003C709E56